MESHGNKTDHHLCFTSLAVTISLDEQVNCGKCFVFSERTTRPKTMTTFVKYLLVFCVLVRCSYQESANDNDSVTDSGRKLVDPVADDIEEEKPPSSTPKFGKLSDKKAKPLRSIFMGLYRNYKSTYLGNKTSLEYRKSLKDVDQEKALTKRPERKDPISIKKNKKVKGKKKAKRGTIKKSDPLIYSYDNEYKYEIGQGVNLTLDMTQDTVSVNLDEENIKDILLGIWKSDDEESEEGWYEGIKQIFL